MKCTKCSKDKPLSEFHRDKQKATGYRVDCKACRLLIRKERYTQGKTKELSMNAIWQSENREHKNYVNTLWSKGNRASKNHSEAKRKARRVSATPSWADEDAIKRMYIVSRFLSEHIEPYHVDHVIPLQGNNICGLHVEYNLDVIPALDNLRKGVH